jgi:hypothetical protein
MNKINFLIPLLILCLLSCQKRDDHTERIEDIEFSYISGLRIPYNTVTINITRNNKDSSNVFIQIRPLFDTQKWGYSKIDEIVKIDNLTFEKIKLLDHINMDKAHKIGNDGSTWKIEYGAKGKNKRYKFWSPTFQTKKRGLDNFVQLSEQILDISKLKKILLISKIFSRTNSADLQSRVHEIFKVG